MKGTSEFSIHNKTEIYFNQLHKNYKNLEQLNLPFILSHLFEAKKIENRNNLIICPLCINCYIYPGKNVSNELNKKYKIFIEDNTYIFDNWFIRPAECDYIISPSKGGNNSISNGVYICSQCYRQKAELNIRDFINIYFSNNFVRYFKKNDLIKQQIELMDVDNFNNRCLNCNYYNNYRICIHCAGKKDEIINVAI